MRIEDTKMSNSAVLQLIIEELGKSTLSWGKDKELFELICAPLSYENDTTQKRRECKEAILEQCIDKNMDTKRFHTLANNIFCGEHESQQREALIAFMIEQKVLSKDIRMLIEDIPCKSKDEKNYKNNFNNWKNGKTDRINRREVKERIEKNFHFGPALWEMDRYLIKHAVKEGVAQFVERRKQVESEMTTLFDTLRHEFNMQEVISDKEVAALERMKQFPQYEMLQYLRKHHPLSKFHTQEFIQALIPILCQKGYYTLLLDEVIGALDIHLQESDKIRKIKANIYGSPLMGEYLKAFNILSMIKADNDIETISIQTEALSNIRRHFLRDKSIQLTEKREVIRRLITHYHEVFKYHDTFHYYPAINMIYMIVIDAILSEDEKPALSLAQTIDDIYHKCKHSMKIEKKSRDIRKYYFANITKIEFSLLKGTGTPVVEMARFLELEEEKIPLAELTRTQRQMQCVVDCASLVQSLDYPVLNRIASAIEIIDDFMEFRK